MELKRVAAAFLSTLRSYGAGKVQTCVETNALEHAFLHKSALLSLRRSAMFIEVPTNTAFSSVGAASVAGRCRSYGASKLCTQTPINIALLRSGGKLVQKRMLPRLRGSTSESLVESHNLGRLRYGCPSSRAKLRIAEKIIRS